MADALLPSDLVSGFDSGCFWNPFQKARMKRKRMPHTNRKKSRCWLIRQLPLISSAVSFAMAGQLPLTLVSIDSAKKIDTVI